MPRQVVDAVAGKLGAGLSRCRDLTQAARMRGRGTIGSGPMGHTLRWAPKTARMRDAGHASQRIADDLNAEGRRTRRGAAWDKVQVGWALDRIRAAEPMA